MQTKCARILLWSVRSIAGRVERRTPGASPRRALSTDSPGPRVNAVCSTGEKVVTRRPAAMPACFTKTSLRAFTRRAGARDGPFSAMRVALLAGAAAFALPRRAAALAAPGARRTISAAQTIDGPERRRPRASAASRWPRTAPAGSSTASASTAARTYSRRSSSAAAGARRSGSTSGQGFDSSWPRDRRRRRRPAGRHLGAGVRRRHATGSSRRRSIPARRASRRRCRSTSTSARRPPPTRRWR